MTTTTDARDADIARAAAAIADPSRARVLQALVEGRALPASVLATEAGVSASTVSGHLAKLLDAGVVRVERHGRHRYYRLSGPAVAEAIEALARIAPPLPVTSLRQSTHAHALRRARTCYDHVAGALGVALMAALLERGILEGGDGHYDPAAAKGDRLSAPGNDTTYRLTAPGRAELAAFGVDADGLPGRRPLIRYCVDWTEQRHHLAGALGAAVTDRLFELGWIRRGTRRRVVDLTDAGRTGLERTFGVVLNT
ncbi:MULTISPECIES: ArsR/SmtB family transcription factor [Streptomyces]|uniref:DNA-binding transcriptional ArsR family regulator n=2 Tax=Streptomyces TaxID=1883 RepID=A0ABT9KQ37_9ACTN|nr:MULTISPECIES: helix-turn-helix domain-containing protein [Streptomyces]MBW8093563.1 helix-turn-helix transcriptional regulator [Streptomyces hygroscopicus subsp. hygroscopicus]MCO8305957.1 helix-turn-helix domain-containing protein [Streptomyces sp. RKCA744]MDN3057530.1 helix-turn-helix domain-containing protein [Streptomyces sp. SRF1]MDP9610559.1 DNA-binding transcriptional ArsR family regulator [Streptomyces demainii]GHJ28947.1 transcriptional regulator [Streptomyces hygroscopicus]